jgi:hypothetical protein
MCKTHRVVREVDGKNVITAPYMVTCLLMTMKVKEIREGKHGECEIVRVG